MYEITWKYIIIITSIVIITRESTIKAVIWLIILFVEIGIWAIIKESEWIGWIIIIVYGGAIAILFLFVVIMIEEKEKEESIKGWIWIIRGIIWIIGEKGNKLEEQKEEIIGRTEIEVIGEKLIIEQSKYIISGSLLLLLVMVGIIKIIGRKA